MRPSCGQNGHLGGRGTGLLGRSSGRSGHQRFAVSTFDTDYLLVKDAAWEQVTAAMLAAGHLIQCPAPEQHRGAVMSTVAEELNRLHAQFQRNVDLVAAFLQLAGRAIHQDLYNAERTQRTLTTMTRATTKHKVIFAVPTPDGSIAHPKMEDLEEQLRETESHLRNVAPHFPTLALRMASFTLSLNSMHSFRMFSK